MITCKINGKEVSVEPGTTVLEAARGAGFDVPSFCYHPGLSKPANCRMCLVEASNSPKPIPSCYLGVAPDAEYTTDSENVRDMRRAILEFILLNHPVDCPICDQAGECELQDNYFDFSLQQSRLETSKVHKPKATPFSDRIMFDGERCIVCTRCVRFCDEIAKSSELGVAHRGEHSEIAIFPGHELSNPYQMNIVDLCPVGALTSRDFRFKIRVWFMETVESVCNGCARGCNVHLDHHKGEAMRYRPRENARVNEWWMCDAGRLSYTQFHENRLLAPVVRQGGEPKRADWDAAIDAAHERISGAKTGQVAFVVNATVDNETAYMVRRLEREVLPKARVYVAMHPDGHDQDDILLRNDKNPNRAGLGAILGDRPGVDALRADLGKGKVSLVVIIGDAVTPGDLKGAKSIVMLATHVVEAARGADVLLPLQSHAEHDGSFVNFQGRVQRFQGAIAPVGEALAGWQILAKLSAAFDHQIELETDGAVFKALAAEHPAFAGMTHFNLGSTGTTLVTPSTVESTEASAPA